MNSTEKYFVFIFPARGEIRKLLNLAVFALSPREKWPAHVTVAGPFQRRPHSRSNPNFNRTIFSLGVWNFFDQGLNTVYLKVGMPGMDKYWFKPTFMGNPVAHLSLYNGDDSEFAKDIFLAFQPIRLFFSFHTEGLEVVKSTSQKQFSLREEVDVNIMSDTKGMSLDDIVDLGKVERLRIAETALRQCKSIIH